ncbi:hypothetical protein ACHFCA_29350 [Delftia tsuruhatensis]
MPLRPPRHACWPAQASSASPRRRFPRHQQRGRASAVQRAALLETLAVVADDRPLGLINRQRFMEQYARPFARDVFGRRSCLVFTDTAPMVVAAGLPIDQLVQQALASGSRVLKDGFITVEEGRYAGIGTGHALMAAMSTSRPTRRASSWPASTTPA